MKRDMMIRTARVLVLVGMCLCMLLSVAWAEHRWMNEAQPVAAVEELPQQELLLQEEESLQTEILKEEPETEQPIVEPLPTEDSITQAAEEEAEDEYGNLAIAKVDHYVNVRSAPGTDGDIVGKMYDGSVAQILSVVGEEEEWFQVISGEVEGYIKAEFFVYGEEASEVLDQYVTHYAQVDATRLNVRREPELTAGRIGYVDQGEKLRVLESLDDWVRIEYAGAEEAYVAKEYVTVQEEYVYAKSIEEERLEKERLREQALREQASEQEAAENTEPGQAATQNDYSVPVNGDIRSSIVSDAMQYLGNAYVHGGSSLATGTDCSGFTCFIYADFGYSISRTPSGQLASAGRSIDISQIQPGDIVCYSTNGKSCTHVGLYIGDGQIIHAANPRKGVVISDVNYSPIIGIKNVID